MGLMWHRSMPLSKLTPIIRACGIMLNFFSSISNEVPFGDHDFFWYVEKLKMVSSKNTNLDPDIKATLRALSIRFIMLLK